MSGSDTFEIRRTRLLLVEGRDEREFFGALCDDLAVSNVQVREFDGKDNLGNVLRTLPALPKFETLERLGIIRDADHDAGRALKSVETALLNANLPLPENHEATPAVSVIVMPPGQASGCLESLLWEHVAVHHASIAECIDAFVECAEIPENGTRREKARIYAFIASQPKPGLKIGEAARAGYWDFSQPVFDPIKTFIKELSA